MSRNNYTHNARFYGIPCYFNVITSEIEGKNWCYSVLLGIAIWIEQKFPSNEYGFPIEIGEEIK